MKRKKIITCLSLFSIIALTCVSIFIKKETNTLYAESMNEIDKITLKINTKNDELINSNSDYKYLSSPYAIVKNNEAYQELVDLGVVAIKPLKDKISESKESGLIEYIYAMAIEDIMSQNFEYQNDIAKEHDIHYGWASSKEFNIGFTDFIHQINDSYLQIKEDSTLNESEKNEKIIELGLGVVPYLIEDIEKSSIDLNYENILTNLLLEKKQISSTPLSNYSIQENETFNVNNWIKENKAIYEMLKEI